METLIIYAVKAELTPWWGLRGLESRALGEWTIHQAQIGRAAVDFIVTGMGQQNARRAAEAAMAKTYTNCVVAGFCGGLRPGYAVGDVVVAGTVERLGDSRRIDSSKGLVSAAEADGARFSEKLITVDEVVATAEEKARIAPYAAVVDMESFAVMDVALARRVPAVVIRAVSDTYDQDMPAYVDKMVDQKGRLRLAEATRTIVRHPMVLPALVRLGRHSATAAQALAQFLERYLKKVSSVTQVELTPELAKATAR